MNFVVWIVGGEPSSGRRLGRAWRDTAGNQAAVRRFASASQALAQAVCLAQNVSSRTDPSRQEAGTAERLPDLVQFLQPPDDSGTDLMLFIRRFQAADVMYLPENMSGPMLRRARQLGACGCVLLPASDQQLRVLCVSCRSYLASFQAEGPLDQREIDRLLGSCIRGAVRGSPAASAADTSSSLTLPPRSDWYLQLLLAAASLPEGVTASQAAEKCHISRVSARRYLDRLVQAKWLSVYSHCEGKPGRPAVYYRFRQST